MSSVTVTSTVSRPEKSAVAANSVSTSVTVAIEPESTGEITVIEPDVM